MKLYWWQLRLVHPNSAGMRDHKVQAERHKAAIKLARLQYKRRNLDEREIQLREEIRSIGRSEAWAKYKRREARISLVFFIAALFLTVGATLWTLQPMELSLG